jgi:hypothetical protein
LKVQNNWVCSGPHRSDRWGAPVRPVPPRTEPIAPTFNMSGYESKIWSRCTWDNLKQICVEKHEEINIWDWTCATGQTGDGHQSDWCRPSDPKSWVLTMCPTKPYGSIGMSSRWSQKMFYQRKFKSLHHVRRSGKRKIWIPLERGTRVESKELEGEWEEGPWRILLLPILSLSLGWIFKTPWGKERCKKGGEGVLHGLEEE